MIDKLELKNFEIHKNTVLNFTPGVNYITGSSDQGKSTIRKAIDLVRTNRPAGTGYIQKKKTKSEVILHTNGKKISRKMEITKSGTLKVNQYQIDDNPPMKALKMNVPEEVSNAINMNDINVQGQFEQFFLLQETGGGIAKKFNDILGLESIDRILSKATKVVNLAKVEKDAAEKEVKAKKEELTQFEDLKAIERLVRKAENNNKNIIKNEIQIQNIQFQIELYEKVKKRSASAEKLLQAGEELQNAQEIIYQIKTMKERIDKGRICIDMYMEKEEMIESNRKKIGAETEIKKARKLIDEIKIKVRKMLALKTILHDQETLEKKSQEALKIKEQAEKALKDYIKKNPLCPTCNKPWKEGHNHG